MLAFQVLWMDQALADLRGIRAYLAEFSQQAALRIVTKIVDQADRLAAFPYRCRVVFAQTNIRRLIVEDYSVFYRVSEERRFIQVLYVWHHAKVIQSAP
jgi:addiction module RelE/StbE family toxin